MSRSHLFNAGTSFGRGHIFAIVGNSQATYHINRAAQYLQAARHPALAREARSVAQSPDAGRVATALHQIQRAIPMPDQHAYSAGVNLGWAIETCAGQQAADVHKVVENLQHLAAHAKALSSNDRQVDYLVNQVLNPIKNLVNAQHPKPRELPQHKPRVERLAQSLRGLLR